MPVDTLPLCGIGDEAGASAAVQTGALNELGWPLIELRSVDGTALADLGDAAFADLAGAVHAAGLRVHCVDSRIANWARPVTGDFDDDLRELDVLAERCARLGTRYVRVMSYPNDGLRPGAWRAVVLRRMAALAARAERAGLVLLHENCAGWAGASADRMLQLLRYVDSPALRLVFDTGNGPAYGYRALDLLPALTPWIEHVQIKDAVVEGDEIRYTLPGHGECRVADCLRHLLDRGYTGALSIEPHVKVRPHESATAGDDETRAAFVACGRALEELLGRIRKAAA